MIKRLMAFLLVMMVVISAQAQTITSAQIDSNIRSGPGTEWRILGVAKPNTTIALDGQAFGGTWVRGITSTGITGWMFRANLTISEGEAAALPPVLIETPFTLGAPEQVGAIGGVAAPSAPSAPADGTTTTAPPVVVSTSPVTGFNYGAHVAGLSEPTVGWMRVAGMTWAKRQVKWYPGNDPAGLRGMIDEAHNAGLRLLVSIVGEPGRVTEPGYFDQYAAYAAGVAAQGVDAIEVWNEPNIDREWASGAISGALYTELLRKSYIAIKAANPNVMVVSGAPSPTGFFGGCTPAGCDDKPFIEQMYAAGAANYMDCLGVHYNEGVLPPTATSGDPRGNPLYYTRYYPTMVNTYLAAFRNTRKLCFTELGYLSGEGYPGLPGSFLWAQNTTVAQQAQWIDQVVSIAARSNRVSLLIIWNMDFANWGDDPQAGFALIRPGGDCPACRALAE
ncbi:MAG: SH3 domain-containing protein [Anaerolineae bacterium]|nr:SH3 domain-containing protein [Anaerolineae bacterium]